MVEQVEGPAGRAGWCSPPPGSEAIEQLTAARRDSLSELLEGWDPEDHPEVVEMIRDLARALLADDDACWPTPAAPGVSRPAVSRRHRGRSAEPRTDHPADGGERAQVEVAVEAGRREQHRLDRAAGVGPGQLVAGGDVEDHHLVGPAGWS